MSSKKKTAPKKKPSVRRTPATVEVKTPSPSATALKSTFTHAATAVGSTNDGELAAELNQAITDKNYSAALATRAADVIEQQSPAGNAWLISDLRSIS